MFGELPFLDWFALPAIALDELGAIAEEAVSQEGAATLDGFGTACMLASFPLFVRGDMDRYQRLGDLANGSGSDDLPREPGLRLGHRHARRGTRTGGSDGGALGGIARATGDPALLAWTLAHYSVLQTSVDHFTAEGESPAVAAAEEAITLARRQPGSVACLYPLAAMVQANMLADPERAREAARRRGASTTPNANGG